MAHEICEGIWLKQILEELKIPTEGPIKMVCDNQAAISIAKNPMHHDRTKHVELDRHFVKEKIEGTVALVYTPSGLQTTDILTKALPRIKFEELKSKLGGFNQHLQPNLRVSIEIHIDSKIIIVILFILLNIL